MFSLSLPRKSMFRALSLILALIAIFYGFGSHPQPIMAATLLHHDFATPIDDPSGSNPSSPLQWSADSPSSMVTTNVADANASDGKVAKLTLPAGVAAEPGFGPNIQTKQRFQYGTYQSRIKAAACSTSVGAVTGVFTYFNDGSDSNGNGIPDNSEIDFEWLCAEPQVVFITMWTDYDPVTNAQSRVYREIDLSTGTIRQQCYAQQFGSCTSIANSPMENQPSTLPAISGYSSSIAYYTVGITWTATEVVWFIYHPVTGAKIVLWDYKGPSSRITQVPAYYMINTWHTSDWTPTGCCANATGSPTTALNTYLDWIDISSNTSTATSTATVIPTIIPATATKTNTPIPFTATATSIPPTKTPTSVFTNTLIPATATSIPNGNGSPYSGTPYAIPGKVEAENYNTGGEGVAYHDNEAANQGGAYRPSDGVDIEPCTDTGCGYDVGWTVTGEWLKYTVNVQTTGLYNLDFRVASAQSGATFHLEVDGANVTGTLTVPNTAGWQTWATISKTSVSLTSGQHVLRLYNDNGGGNYNWINFSTVNSSTSTPTSTFTPTVIPSTLTSTFTPTFVPTKPTSTFTPTATVSKTSTPTATVNSNGSPYSGTPYAIPGKVEAENYNTGGEGIAYHDNEAANQGGAYRPSDGVDIESCTDTGCGYDVGWTVTGEWLKYTVNVATTGLYNLDFRVASAQSGATFHLEVDSANVTGTLTVPNTGGWQTWATVSKTSVSLTSGQHVLRLYNDNGGGNYNWINFSPTGQATATFTPSPTLTPVASSGKVEMAYFGSWTGMAASSIPASKLTHVLYAFSNLDAGGNCMPQDSTAATAMSGFKTLKQQYPHLKVLVSIGGWTNSGNFSANVATAALRQHLVQSCINLWIKGTGLAGPGVVDGLDIDWEYPGSAGNTNNFTTADKANYVAMMQEFRNQLNTQGTADGRYYSISAAFNTYADRITAGYDLTNLAPLLDYFNLMTYDFHGPWNTTGPTDFHSNLYVDPAQSADNSVDTSVKLFISYGVPASKIVVGIPFYGAAWTGVGSANNGLYQPATSGSNITYKDIKASYESNSAYTKYRNAAAHAPWLYSASTGTFIAYDDPPTITEKAQYIVSNGLAGAMFWELSQDDAQFTLTSTLCMGLGAAASGRTC